jgi:hypothetical protein
MHRILITTLVCCVTLFTADLARAQGTIYNWEQGSGQNRAARLWIPDGVDTIKGILIVGNGAGGDSRSDVNLAYNQAFAKLHGFAIIATGRFGMMDNAEYTGFWLPSLASLAAASGHPELVHAPYAPVGLSNGGQMSYGFNVNAPEKTIAFIANKGQFYYTSNLPVGHAALKTPGILIAGETDTIDRRNSIRNLFLNNRTASKGALWTWVEQENTGHARLANELVFALMAEAIKARYPVDQVPTASSGVTLTSIAESSGWLADTNSWTSGLTYVDSYANYTGNKAAAGWLLNEGMANAYRAFSTYDKTVSITGSNPTHSGTTEVVALAENDFTFNITVNTSALSNFTKVELFSLSEKLDEHIRGAGLENSVFFDVTLPGPGVHAIYALVTHADGTTISTSNLRTYIAIPEPGSVGMGLVLAAAGLSMRRRKVGGLRSRS